MGVKVSVRVVTVVAGIGLTTAACANTDGAENDTATYPGDRPITIVVGFNPGGGTDLGARLMASALEEELDATVEVSNKPGAAGQVGLTEVANAKADGYTLGTINLPTHALFELMEEQGATFERDDFTTIGLMVQDPTMIGVAPDSPYETLDDLLSAAAKQPDTIRVSTTGVATDEHFTMLQLEEMGDAEFAPVHFTDGFSAALPAFLSGNNVEVLIANASSMAGLVEDGSVRPLGVMAEERLPQLPDVPTFVEQGYDLVMGSGRGFVFPADVDEGIVDKLSSAMEQVLENDEVREKLTDLRLNTSYLGPEEFAEYWKNVEGQYTPLLHLAREDS